MPTQIGFEYRLQTGLHSNSHPQETNSFSSIIQLDGVKPLRVRFAAAHLGKASSILLTSLKDGQQHRLDTEVLKAWGNISAMLNGNAVRMDLLVAPGDEGVFAEVDSVIWPMLNSVSPDRGPNGPALATLCGDDNRVPSSDNRVGRIPGCTAWLISNGAVLCAGHCTDNNGNLSGSFEVNVPASDSDGSPNAAAVADQFPINTGSVQWGNGSVTGDDWCVFGLNANSLGENAHLKFGFFRVSQANPGTDATVRITGFGVDNTPTGSSANACCSQNSSGTCTHRGCNSRNRTQQTGTGDLDNLNTDGAARYWNYDADTEPANSGSPIIWTATGFTIGIHTTGNCTAGSDNYGTAFAFAPLANAMNSFPGGIPRYMDNTSYPGVLVRDGNIFRPFQTLSEAYSTAPNNATVHVVEGTFPKSRAGNVTTIGSGSSKTVTFRAPVGRVHVGE
ncbi:MAG: trypsin-like serine protease [Verrucomicrobia bacterium]|nr:trypsin-like serine protease [Verrucomicrobiota bacterium]